MMICAPTVTINYQTIEVFIMLGKVAGGGITIFIHRGLIYNIKHDLSVSNDDTETPCLWNFFLGK